ncbi:uncharacterized protein BDZ99DRAFT_466203 [Mytilinidion resinicola]|uniref:Uncharacterized protein n=1 Tax=Mytilinidion resinicola TaxID=574789 RepID=A0A6A6YCM6_9PEZI|nr:uncharacterized protein BDZ99DRAFT_466203 [Mytilinidion resinicola]KAF2805855.1 hypothetical protein BDZ99DRAFT_466203 [Mytilinidion resinicola]
MAYIKLGLVALGAYALGKKKARDARPPPPTPAPARYEEPNPPRYQEAPRYQESPRSQEAPRYQEPAQQDRYLGDSKH